VFISFFLFKKEPIPFSTFYIFKILYSSAITKVTLTKSPFNINTPNIDTSPIRNQLLKIRKNIQKIEKGNI